ncbi:hypothetical protein [Streptomyces sp. NPDC057418]|uniref:hypothetical protein n=1 Tax=Streptomyces sp. NPDC057418 TaxID=3346126 RepID=UPI0036B51DE7
MATRDEELLARVREMKERGGAPKQIAKALGLRPAQATALVRRAAEVALANIAPDERPVVGCWVNAGWSTGLHMAKAPEWAAAGPLGQEPDPGTGGFAQILLARQERASRVTVTGILVDVYCLGVKNVTDPEVMGSGSLTTYVPMYYSAFDHRPVPIGVEQAQTIVHDAVAYARSLGFDPRGRLRRRRSAPGCPARRPARHRLRPGRQAVLPLRPLRQPAQGGPDPRAHLRSGQLQTSRPRKTSMSPVSITCILRSCFCPASSTAPIATSTLRRASRPAKSRWSCP